ncbi:unnamed protein product [Prorocentrum cordatum]|uniref:Uncharacterized protein n=1 Tax=Prorocentrum cordatum TaxID=2364126 RepID=A0ABN9Y4I7_9DINO|nr:unnamed protein product [Polarella glacialis]
MELKEEDEKKKKKKERERERGEREQSGNAACRADPPEHDGREQQLQLLPHTPTTVAARPEGHKRPHDPTCTPPRPERAEWGAFVAGRCGLSHAERDARLRTLARRRPQAFGRA